MQSRSNAAEREPSQRDAGFASSAIATGERILSRVRRLLADDRLAKETKSPVSNDRSGGAWNQQPDRARAERKVGKQVENVYNHVARAHSFAAGAQMRLQPTSSGQPLRVLRLKIENFRSVEKVELMFRNRMASDSIKTIGLGTICDALELVVGPDRLQRYPPVEESDFHKSEYVGEDGITPKKLMVEVMLVDLSEEIERRCGAHIEYWDTAEQKVVAKNWLGSLIPDGIVKCLRLQTIICYNGKEDDFEANTYFPHNSTSPGIEMQKVGRGIKRMCGFLRMPELSAAS